MRGTRRGIIALMTPTASPFRTGHTRRRDALCAGLFVLASVAGLGALGYAALARAFGPLARAALALGATGGWLAVTLAAERALRAIHPDAPHGRWARWRHPWRGPAGRALDALANSRLLGVLLEPLPEPAMRSDIRDVVYVNYVLPAERARALVPEGLVLDTLGPDGRWALFSFLTYRHGHFGFRALGPLRRLLPSPIQTNWRVHVRDPRRGTRGVYFVTNAIASTPLALAARLTTRGMPMHVLARASLERPAPDAVRVALDPGAGSAPDAQMDLRDAPPPALAGPWRECWPDWRAFLAYCVPQDRAMATQPEWGQLSRHEIDLGIPLEACVPLAGTVRSARARALAGDEAQPLCFRVPAVRFVFDTELREPLAQPAGTRLTG